MSLRTASSYLNLSEGSDVDNRQLSVTVLYGIFLSYSNY
jgi:hypothetical protein